MAIDIENYRLKIGTFHPSRKKCDKIGVNIRKTANKYKNVKMKPPIFTRLIGIFLVLVFLLQEYQNLEPVGKLKSNGKWEAILEETLSSPEMITLGQWYPRHA